MKVLHTTPELRRWRALLDAKKTVGLVPTMGALHDGHLSLVRLAQDRCSLVLVTIFVNPTQFAPGEDFDAYPRTLDADLANLRTLNVDAVFAPQDASDMYPNPPERSVRVGIEHMSLCLDGIARPHFFFGVATLLSKLFVVTRPTHTFFGQKDGQQAAIVKALVRDLLFDICVVVGPTVRESDGLAMSSRNRYLSSEDRARAPKMYEVLRKARDDLTVETGNAMKHLVETELRKHFDLVEYVGVVGRDSLKPIHGGLGGESVIVAAAVRLPSTRLLDNVVIQRDSASRD